MFAAVMGREHPSNSDATIVSQQPQAAETYAEHTIHIPGHFAPIVPQQPQAAETNAEPRTSSSEVVATHPDIKETFPSEIARGKSLLNELANGKFSNEEYVAHLELELQPRMYEGPLFVTYNSIIAVDRNSALSWVFSETRTVVWEVLFRNITSVCKESGAIRLVYRGDDQETWIEIENKGQRDWLFAKIEMAMAAFNHKSLSSKS